MEKISIIIPVYNSAKYLNRCLGSILNQEYQNYEVILVDDGSSDNSSQICNLYSKKNKRIRFYRLKHCGVSKCRNFALSHVTGDFLLFVDSDDELTPGLFKNIIDVFKDKTIDMCVFKIRKVFEDGKEYTFPIYKNTFVDYKAYARSLTMNDDGPYGGGYIANKMIRVSSLKKSFNDIPRFDEDFFVYEDKLWYLKIASKINRIYLMDFTGYIYYVHTGSLSSRNDSERCINHYQSIKELYQYAIKYNFFNRDIEIYCSNIEISLLFTLYYRKKVIYKDKNSNIKYKFLSKKNKIKYLICLFKRII